MSHVEYPLLFSYLCYPEYLPLERLKKDPLIITHF